MAPTLELDDDASKIYRIESYKHIRGGEDISRLESSSKTESSKEPNTFYVPKGWPTQLKSKLAWDGAQFHGEAEYIYVLSDEEKTEIDAALQLFKGSLFLRHVI